MTPTVKAISKLLNHGVRSIRMDHNRRLAGRGLGHGHTRWSALSSTAQIILAFESGDSRGIDVFWRIATQSKIDKVSHWRSPEPGYLSAISQWETARTNGREHTLYMASIKTLEKWGCRCVMVYFVSKSSLRALKYRSCSTWLNMALMTWQSIQKFPDDGWLVGTQLPQPTQKMP